MFGIILITMVSLVLFWLQWVGSIIFWIIILIVIWFCVGIIIWHGMSHCSCHTFIIMWHNLSQMANFVDEPCSLTGRMMDDFH